jgi:hypothetical protein
MDYRTSEKSGCNAFTPVSIIERYEYVYLQIAPTTEVGGGSEAYMQDITCGVEGDCC